MMRLLMTAVGALAVLVPPAAALADHRDGWHNPAESRRDYREARRDYREARRDYLEARRDYGREYWRHDRGWGHVQHEPYWHNDRRGWSDHRYYNRHRGGWAPYGESYYRDRHGVYRPGPGDWYRDPYGRFIRYSAPPVWYGTNGRRYRDYYACRRGSNLDGAVIGAVLGGLLGDSVARPGDRTEGAIAGAVLGGIAGGAIDSASGRRCY